MATPLFTGKHPDEVQRTFIPRRLFNGDLVQRTNAQDHSLGRPDGASMPRLLGEEPRPPLLEAPQAGEPGVYSSPLPPLPTQTLVSSVLCAATAPATGPATPAVA